MRNPAAMLKAIAGSVFRISKDRHQKSRFYPGLERSRLNRAVRAELLLSQIQRAIDHQSSWQRPWQRYEPLSGFLDADIWPTDQTVMQDLSFAKLAVEILSDNQRQQLESALEE